MNFKWINGKIFFLAAVFLFGAGIAIFLKIGDKIPLEGEKVHILKNPGIAVTDIKISYMETAYAETLEAFVFGGGSLFKPVRMSHNAVLIEHPSGSLLFDTGLGKDIDLQFRDMPLWAIPVFQYKKIYSAKEILEKNGKAVERIFLSHLHFDHASGIEDFPESDINTTQTELNFARSEEARPPAFLSSQYDGRISWKIIEFTSGPYEIFEKSFDLFGDGSIVFVPLQGHSPESLGMFINRSPDERYFFTGDITWHLKGLTNPSEKNLLAGYWVDFSRMKTRDEIRKIFFLLKEKPEIKAVPAHDGSAYVNFTEITHERK